MSLAIVDLSPHFKRVSSSFPVAGSSCTAVAAHEIGFLDVSSNGSDRCQDVCESCERACACFSARSRGVGTCVRVAADWINQDEHHYNGQKYPGEEPYGHGTLIYAVILLAIH